MRYLLIISLLLCSYLSFAQKNELNSFVKKLPDKNKTVTDFGRFFTSSERDTLDVVLKDYLKQTTNAIVVVTLGSLTDPKTDKEYTIEEAALAYFNTWGIGDKEKNNGVLIMVSRDPRKVRIQVGSGLETILTNETCQQIIDNNLVPNFKNGLFFTGLKEAVIAIEQRLNNPAPAEQQATAPYLRTTIKHESVDKPYGNNNPVIGFSIIGGILLVCILYLKFGRPLSNGWYTRDGYKPQGDDWRLFGDHSSGSGWTSGGSSGGSSSSGGGASGGW